MRHFAEMDRAWFVKEALLDGILAVKHKMIEALGIVPIVAVAMMILLSAASGTMVVDLEFSMPAGMYAAAVMICITSALEIWQSRRLENSGKSFMVMSGAAGLLIAAVLILGGSWFNTDSMRLADTHSGTANIALHVPADGFRPPLQPPPR